MSRSNIDKPFFVDVGTSIAAVRCQSNMDVLDRFDHVSLGNAGIEMAEKMCDRMNAEVDKFVAAKDAEIERLKFDNLHLKSCQRTSGEVIIEQTNKVEAKDAEIAKLRALVGELADALLAACNDTCDYCKKLLNIGDASALMCLQNHQCNVGQAYGRLVAKAREVTK